MIRERNTDVDDREMTGMTVTTDSMTVLMTSGSYVINKDDDIAEVTYTIPEVSFDVIPDDTVDTVYDLYLVDNQDNPLYLKRTEMGRGVVPFYDGPDNLLICLLTLSVPPNETVLDNVTITVNKVVISDEDNTTSESTVN